MQKKIKTFISIIVAMFFVWFLWYTISPLFIDKTVNEEMPVLENGEVQEVSYEYAGNFADADAIHKVSGEVKVFTQTTGERYLRFENFQSTNGPDLYVYLSNGKGNEDFVNLGKLKGNMGDQNYGLSSDVDLEKYGNVLIWCQRFSVLFGSAEIEKV